MLQFQRNGDVKMEQNTVKFDDDRETNLRLMFANILQKWRNILLVMIVFCVLIMAYKTYKSIGASVTSTDSTTDVAAKLSVANKEIKDTQASIDYLNDYIKNSEYANIDPYNETETTTNISIITSSSSDDLESLLKSTNHANQITQAYSTFILKTIDYSDISKKLDLSENSIKELISAKPNFDADSITMTVIGTDSKQTEEISTYILNQVNDEQSQIKSLYGDHTLVTSKTQTNVIVDSTLMAPAPAANSTTPYANNIAMANAMTKLSTMQATLSTEEKNLSSLSTTTPATGISKKNLLKYGMLGLLGGLVLAMLFYAIKFALEDKISSEDDLKNLYGVKILATLPMEIPAKRYSKLDVISYRQIDSSYGIGKDIAIEKAMMNISGYAGDKKSILLIGSGVKQNLDELQDKLQALNKDIKFNTSNNINADSNELAKLKDTDGVIVVAERNETRIDDFTKSVETIYNWKKEIIGSIVL